MADIKTIVVETTFECLNLHHHPRHLLPSLTRLPLVWDREGLEDVLVC